MVTALWLQHFWLEFTNNRSEKSRRNRPAGQVRQDPKILPERIRPDMT